MDGPYRPPPPIPAPPRGDRWGWALVGIPVAGAVAEAFVPWPGGWIVPALTLLVTMALIVVDARYWGRSAGLYVAGSLFLWLVFFPLYLDRRRAWGGRPLFRYALMAVALTVVSPFARRLLGRDSLRASVSCIHAGKLLRDGFKCTVRHTFGNRAAQVCWDLSLTCADGPGGSGHACAVVTAGGTTEVAVPLSEFVGSEGCHGLAKAKLVNVVVNESPLDY